MTVYLVYFTGPFNLSAGVEVCNVSSLGAGVAVRENCRLCSFWERASPAGGLYGAGGGAGPAVEVIPRG